MWTHKKHGQTTFRASYERDKDYERVFVLFSGKGRKITFESHQAAKAQGWQKVKK